MMAAAVCLGEDISPKRLLSLGNLLLPSCLSQGRWKLGNPGSKYIQFLPSPSSRGHSSMLQNLGWAVLLQKAPQCTSKPSSMSCTAATSPCPPLSSDRTHHQSKGHPALADQWLLPTDSQCLWNWPQFPQGWWFTNAPHGTVTFVGILSLCQCQDCIKFPAWDFCWTKTTSPVKDFVLMILVSFYKSKDLFKSVMFPFRSRTNSIT